MQVRTTILMASVFLLGLFGSGCGYLDTDIFVDDESFDQEFTMEGLSLRGSGGGWGCGGSGGYGYSSSSSGHYLARRQARVPNIMLSDAHILANTNIDMVDEGLESDDALTEAGFVEQMYYQEKAARDQSILAVY